MKDIDTLIFDLDGTLVDSWPAVYKGIAYTLEKMGHPVKTFEEVLTYIPKGMMDTWSLMLKTTDKAYLNQAVDIYKKAFSEDFFQEIVPYPGVDETLEYFRNKEKIVVTNGLAELSWKILRHVKLDQFMDDLIGGDDIGCLKPTACPLDREMDKFDADHQRAMMVGDMAVDMEAGKAAGVFTCAVSYGIGKPEELRAADPDFIIGDIRELKGIVTQ